MNFAKDGPRLLRPMRKDPTPNRMQDISDINNHRVLVGFSF